MEVNDITKEMFVAWQHDPVTLAVVRGIGELRNNIKEALATGRYSGGELERVIGQCQGLAQIYNINFQEDYTDADATSGMESNSTS